MKKPQHPSFLYPSKPMEIHTVAKSIQNAGWVVQPKKDGVRVLLCHDGKDFAILNRYGQAIQKTNLQDWTFVAGLFPTPFLLDGELLGPRQKGKEPNTICLFDAPVLGQDLTSKPYEERLGHLTKLGGMSYVGAGIDTLLLHTEQQHNLLLLKTSPADQWKDLWKRRTDLDEGLVFKRKQSTLQWSLYSTSEVSDQLKLKSLYVLKQGGASDSVSQ